MSEAATNGNGFAARYSLIIQTVLVIAAFFGAGWAGVLSPMMENIKTLQRDYNSDHAWTQKQDVQILKVEDAVRRIDDRHDRYVVPRSEHEIRNKQNSDQMALISERLNELRRDTYRTVTVGDELKRLQIELGDLRKLLNERKQ